jgi:hypothetical protein
MKNQKIIFFKLKKKKKAMPITNLWQPLGISSFGPHHVC